MIINLKILNKKVTLNKLKHALVENELDELSEKVELISTKELTKDLINEYSILKGAKYFSSCVLQNYLAFISANKYIENFRNIQEIFLWKSNGMSEESIKNLYGSDNNFAPTLINSYPSQDE